jgi:hypothetical protein
MDLSVLGCKSENKVAVAVAVVVVVVVVQLDLTVARALVRSFVWWMDECSTL